jgi:hypothetical protein
MLSMTFVGAKRLNFMCNVPHPGGGVGVCPSSKKNSDNQLSSNLNHDGNANDSADGFI